MSQLPDVHARADVRGIALAEVGVRGVAAQITLDGWLGSELPVAATCALYASLPADRRAGHLSRFGEALGALCEHPLSASHLCEAAGDLARRLEADRAGLRLEFSQLVPRAAPVSGAVGMTRIDCAIAAQWHTGAVEFWQEVSTLVQTVCPCSKEMAARGAHNQRCRVTARVQSVGGLAQQELIALLEAGGSAQVYPVLKRMDEKLLTERAYDHPAFVEDVVRDLAIALSRQAHALRYRVEAQSQESIHPHDAYALAEGP